MRLKQIIIPPRHLRERLRQLSALVVGEIDQRPPVRLGHDEHLERPDGPPRADGEKGGVFEDEALALRLLEESVVREHVCAGVLGAVFLELSQLEQGLFREAGGRPDLAVRVRVRAAHCLAFVFEDLHVFVLCGGLGEVEVSAVGHE